MNQINEHTRCLRQSIAMIDKRLKELKEETELLEEARGDLQKQLLDNLDDLDESISGQ